MNLNLDLSYAIDDRINMAGGAEFRNERFEIVEGTKESWTEGSLPARASTPGSNGFTGFGPLTKGNWNRYNFAAYADLEINDRDRNWTVSFAQRIEHFSDFGMTANGKFAGRVGLSDQFALRASVQSASVRPRPVSRTPSTLDDLRSRDHGSDEQRHDSSTNPLAEHFGGQPLKPEKSVNLAMGGVYDSGPFNLSMDFFQIRVSDRLTTSADRQLSPEEIQQLEDDGVIREGGVLARFRFFINDFSTTTTASTWWALTILRERAAPPRPSAVRGTGRRRR